MLFGFGRRFTERLLAILKSLLLVPTCPSGFLGTINCNELLLLSTIFNSRRIFKHLSSLSFLLTVDCIVEAVVQVLFYLGNAYIPKLLQLLYLLLTVMTVADSWTLLVVSFLSQAVCSCNGLILKEVPLLLLDLVAVFLTCSNSKFIKTYKLSFWFIGTVSNNTSGSLSHVVIVQSSIY